MISLDLCSRISFCCIWNRYKLIRVVPKTNEAIDLLRKYEAKGWIDLWTDPVRYQPVDVFLPPSNFSWFEAWVTRRSIREEHLIEDFGV
jgi:hypothetical protein